MVDKKKSGILEDADMDISIEKVENENHSKARMFILTENNVARLKEIVKELNILIEKMNF